VIQLDCHPKERVPCFPQPIPVHPTGSVLDNVLLMVLMVNGYGQSTGSGLLIRRDSLPADEPNLFVVVTGLAHLEVHLSIRGPVSRGFTKCDSDFDGITHNQVGVIPRRFDDVGHVIDLNRQAESPCFASHVNQFSGLIHSLVPCMNRSDAQKCDDSQEA